MKIIVVSDTHGDTESLIRFLKKSENDFSEIWYLGDFFSDGETIAKAFNVPVVSVKGNCDLGVNGPENRVIERLGHKIWLTHGHLYGVKNTLTTLYYKALEKECDLVCFGHTHRALIQEEHSVKLFNPGSPSRPYIGQPASIGKVILSENYINTELITVG